MHFKLLLYKQYNLLAFQNCVIGHKVLSIKKHNMDMHPFTQ